MDPFALIGVILFGVIFLILIPAVIITLIFKLHRQRQEYQNLFESVPCTITVQDKDYRLVGYNREFADRFSPTPGKYCYEAYKGRDRKCEICPVERTFADGETHTSEETRLNRDGSRRHWIVKTSPVKNSKGEIVAAMEMCLDVTHRRILEEELEISHHNYRAIFNNIPNPVFVIATDTFEILDCNKNIQSVYGYMKSEMIGRSFLDLFQDSEKDHYAFKLKTSGVIYRVRHAGKGESAIFVNLRISPSEYWERQVLLVTVSDITKRLEAEHQLSQASKLATLGEMATGVAHELNQPLTVIKMAGSFFMKKLNQEEPIKPEIFRNMVEKISSNVDRANKIINHMRDFARKSDIHLQKVQVNHVLERAYDIFSQQLKLRRIDVQWETDENLPEIMADPSRLEQVFINLLVNARDAIEARWEAAGSREAEKLIFLNTFVEDGKVVAEVGDTGTGIPQSIADKLFEPFFTTKEVGKGTGLGLSISYGIVKDFRGDIRVLSNEYSGARFRLEFPVEEEQSHDR